MTRGGRDLAAQQRALLELLKDREPPPQELDAASRLSDASDEYLERVRGSRGLAMLRTITAWWRRYDLERLAPLTTRALAHAGRLEDELARLGRDPGTPTSADALGIHFLDRCAAGPDPLIAEVASTERALTLVARGDPSRHEIAWDREPAPVLSALLARGVATGSRRGSYRVIVSSTLPGLLAVEADRTEARGATSRR